jgi:hypothetical protein
MAFMDNYEGNKERTDRWIATFPQGRLEAHIVEFNAEKGYVLIQAKAWRNQDEKEPAGVDYAFGYREAYPEKMRRWMIEDTTTSALMRVMALVMGGTEKSTKETMEKVNAADVYDPWTTNLAMCQATKQLRKLRCPAYHHLDHHRNHQLYQSATMGPCVGIKASRKHPNHGAATFAPRSLKSINAHRVGMYYEAPANGSLKYERLH